MSDFRWTEASEKAAYLIAQGNLVYREVAEAVGVTRETVYNWRQYDDFKARVESHLAAIREEIRRVGIADQLKRVQRLNDRSYRMMRVIEARADDPAMASVAGGTTGLMVRKLKSVGSGESATIVEEYEVDTGLLREMREHEKQAAQELGQWAEKREIGGKDGGPIAFSEVLTSEAKAERIAALLAKADSRSKGQGHDEPR